MPKLDMTQPGIWLLCLVCFAVTVDVLANESGAESDWGLVPENTESYQLGLQRLREFSEISPFLKEPLRDDKFQNACLNLNSECVVFLRTDKDRALKSLPDNPEYWRAYLATLSETPIARVPENVELQAGTMIIEATRTWPLHGFLNSELLEAKDMHFVVLAHRRLLAESNFLIDKMVYLATTGIITQAVNVLMAQHAGTYQGLNSRDAKLLDDMLAPLTTAEHSLRWSFHGEARYWAATRDDGQGELNEMMLQDLDRIREYVVHRSEAGWQDFWSGGVDAVEEVPMFSIEVGSAANAYGDYMKNIRLIDVQLSVLTALRTMYEGKTSPGIPAIPPPPHFQWRWSGDALCLTPDNVHVSFRDVPEMCLEYLGAEIFTH